LLADSRGQEVAGRGVGLDQPPEVGQVLLALAPTPAACIATSSSSRA